MCFVNFWHQQDYNSLFKGSIGHVTSKCKRPIDFIRNSMQSLKVKFEQRGIMLIQKNHQGLRVYTLPTADNNN